MSMQTTELERLSNLRLRALSRLTERVPSHDGRMTVSTALRALYDLASSPLTAADALAILHELQVHQVELDMQQEDLRESRIELEAALSRQTEILDLAPVGCLTVDAATMVREVNQAGARLLGCDREAVLGQALSGWMAPHCADLLYTVLARIGAGHPGETFTLQLLDARGELQPVHAAASGDRVAGQFLLALMEPGPEPGPARSTSSP